ncbi:MAG: hypothetical protein ABW048_07155 [Sphingobium sp.]
MTIFKSPILSSTLLSAVLMAGAPMAAQASIYAMASATPADEPGQVDRTYSDVEIRQFANAAIAVTRVDADANIAPADKQAQMLAVVEAEGIDPETFEAIGRSFSSDPAFRERVRAIVTAPGARAAAAPIR